MEDILTNVLPQFLDLETYRSYYKVIKVPLEQIIFLKNKFIKRRIRVEFNINCVRKNVAELYYILPNGALHGVNIKMWGAPFLVYYYKDGIKYDKFDYFETIKDLRNHFPYIDDDITAMIDTIVNRLIAPTLDY